jgi:aryl-alcohol dehydrogenase-like predicted oxidoreductase
VRGDIPQLDAAAARAGATPDAFALAAVLAQPWADVVLSGAATVDQLRSNLAALELAPEAGLESLAEDPAQYWEERSALRWN